MTDIQEIEKKREKRIIIDIEFEFATEENEDTKLESKNKEHKKVIEEETASEEKDISELNDKEPEKEWKKDISDSITLNIPQRYFIAIKTLIRKKKIKSQTEVIISALDDLITEDFELMNALSLKDKYVKDNKGKNRVISVSVPSKMLNDLDVLIGADSFYFSRSESIRVALQRYLKNNLENLKEKRV